MGAPQHDEREQAQRILEGLRVPANAGGMRAVAQILEDAAPDPAGPAEAARPAGPRDGESAGQADAHAGAAAESAAAAVLAWAREHPGAPILRDEQGTRLYCALLRAHRHDGSQRLAPWRRHLAPAPR